MLHGLYILEGKVKVLSFFDVVKKVEAEVRPPELRCFR